MAGTTTPRVNIRNIEPSAYAAMTGLEQYIQATNLDKKLLELIKIRASQINGCAYCVDKHTRHARAIGETEQRIYATSVWRDTPFFTEPERAVLALTEAVTLIAGHHVPDDVYENVRQHFDEHETAQLIMAIATINAWNRIGVTTKMMPPA